MSSSAAGDLTVRHSSDSGRSASGSFKPSMNLTMNSPIIGCSGNSRRMTMPIMLLRLDCSALAAGLADQPRRRAVSCTRSRVASLTPAFPFRA